MEEEEEEEEEEGTNCPKDSFSHPSEVPFPVACRGCCRDPRTRNHC